MRRELPEQLIMIESGGNLRIAKRVHPGVVKNRILKYALCRYGKQLLELMGMRQELGVDESTVLN